MDCKRGECESNLMEEYLCIQCCCLYLILSSQTHYMETHPHCLSNPSQSETSMGDHTLSLFRHTGTGEPQEGGRAKHTANASLCSWTHLSLFNFTRQLQSGLFLQLCFVLSLASSETLFTQCFYMNAQMTVCSAHTRTNPQRFMERYHPTQHVLCITV